jgi:hypothetical protein
VKSIATRRFWQLFQTLPSEIQGLATKNFYLWQRNPSHPSLRFRRLRGSEDRFSIRVGDHYRALGRLAGTKMIWRGSAPTPIMTDWSALEQWKSCLVFESLLGLRPGAGQLTGGGCPAK